jgi:hypothetical protein
MLRTGTRSMQAALRILGHNDDHHGYSLIDRPETSNAWEKVINAKYGILPAKL